MSEPLNAQNASETADSVPADSRRAGVGSSTASIAKIAKPESKFGLGIWSFTNVGLKSVEESNPDASQFTRATATYKLTDVITVGYFQEFWYTYGTEATPEGPGREARATLDDGGLHFSHSKIAVLPFEINLAFLYRQYLPIGENSRFGHRRMGAEQVLFTFSKSIGSFDFAEYVFFTYFNNTQDYYYNRSSALVANTDYEIDQYFYIAWNVAKYFTLVNWIGSEHYWYRGTPEKGVTRMNTFYNETGFVIKPIKQFALSATVMTDAPLDSQNAFTAYQPKDTVYRLYVTISI